MAKKKLGRPKKRGRPRGSYRWTPRKIGLLWERAHLRLSAEDPEMRHLYEAPCEFQKSVDAVAKRIYAEFPGEYQSAEQIRKILCNKDHLYRKDLAAKHKLIEGANIKSWKVLLED